MKRSHRIALKPTSEQESLFGQHAGYARFAYNWALGEFRAGLDVGEWLSERTLQPRWNRIKGMLAPWGAQLSQNAAKHAIIDFGQAAESWGEYRHKVKSSQRTGRRVGFPRFKHRKHEQGFRSDNGPDTVRVDGKNVILPKIGTVPMVEELQFAGSIREVTINRTAGTWFACSCVEDREKAPAVNDEPTIGVDVGMGTMATCFDGTIVENPQVFVPALKRLRSMTTVPEATPGAASRDSRAPGRPGSPGWPAYRWAATSIPRYFSAGYCHDVPKSHQAEFQVA